MTNSQLTVPDIAARLGVSTVTVRSYLSRGTMPAATGYLGRTPWWAPEDVEPWIEGYVRGRASREARRLAKETKA